MSCSLAMYACPLLLGSCTHWIVELDISTSQIVTCILKGKYKDSIIVHYHYANYLQEQENIKCDVVSRSMQFKCIHFVHPTQEKNPIALFSCCMLQTWKVSLIKLVSKVASPKSFHQWRPISLIGELYKILTKVLANRL